MTLASRGLDTMGSLEASLKAATLECRRHADLPPPYEQCLSAAESPSDVVAESKRRLQQLSRDHNVADQIFLDTIRRAKTHPDMVNTLPSSSPADTVFDEVAVFLRYAQAIDKSLESLANTCFPAAVLFACVRFLLFLAVKEMKLFMTVKTHLQEINHRLRRLDLYLTSPNQTDALRFMLCKVMIDLLRFSGLATKYLKSNRLIEYV